MNVIITIIIIIGTNVVHKTCSKVNSSSSNLEYCGKENNRGLNLILHIILKHVSGKNLIIVIENAHCEKFFYLEVSFLYDHK